MDYSDTPAQRIRDLIPAAIAPGDITDPLDQARAYEEALKATQELAVALAGARRRAVTEARQGRTIDTLATELGVTPARIYQIMK